MEDQNVITPEVEEKNKAFAEKMKAAREAKKAAKATQPPSAPPPSLPKVTQQAPPRQAAPAQPKILPKKIVFRLTAKLNPILQKEVIEWARVNPMYMANTSDIFWPYKFDQAKGKPVPLPLDTDTSELYITDEVTGAKMENPAIQWMPRRLRYIYNINTFFEDEQNELMGDMLKPDATGRNITVDAPANRDALLFTHRELKTDAQNKVLVDYLWCSGQCANMHPKARRYKGQPVYQMLDFGQIDKEKIDTGEMRRKAYELAHTARLEELIPHAKHLNIPFTIGDTGQSREWDAIRADYIDKAYQDPKTFLDTFSDPKIKIQYQISRLHESGQLAINSIVAGQAHWRATNKFITMLPPDKNPIEYLADFSITEAGREFSNQLQAFKSFSAL